MRTSAEGEICTWPVRGIHAGRRVIGCSSVGNFFDYVPIRTFAVDGDMGSRQRGFGWSPWRLLLVLGVPTLIAMIWLFMRIVPQTLRRVFPQVHSVKRWSRGSPLASCSASLARSVYWRAAPWHTDCRRSLSNSSCQWRSSSAFLPCTSERRRARHCSPRSSRPRRPVAEIRARAATSDHRPVVQAGQMADAR